jgi:phosphoribosylanthranilate isomerase
MSQFLTSSVNGWIKVCGIREIETAELIAEQSVSAIGLNFFAKSPRFVAPAQAALIVEQLRNRALAGSTNQLSASAPIAVGLFVNHSLEQIEAITAEVDLNTIQLHGDEPPEFLYELHRRHPDWQLLKAFRVGDSLQPIAEFLAECLRLNVPITGCLLDARVDGSFGGTGQVAPWELIAEEYDKAHWPPLILAGGLTPDNVAAAIRVVQPWGIDTASGVESSPGVKETTLLARFVAEARRAFIL